MNVNFKKRLIEDRCQLQHHVASRLFYDVE